MILMAPEYESSVNVQMGKVALRQGLSHCSLEKSILHAVLLILLDPWIILTHVAYRANAKIR